MANNKYFSNYVQVEDKMKKFRMIFFWRKIGSIGEGTRDEQYIEALNGKEAWIKLIDLLSRDGDGREFVMPLGCKEVTT
jgi:hypothetical protein